MQSAHPVKYALPCIPRHGQMDHFLEVVLDQFSVAFESHGQALIEERVEHVEDVDLGIDGRLLELLDDALPEICLAVGSC